jgi:hypothetical protein
VDSQKAFARCGGILNLVTLLTSSNSGIIFEILQVLGTLAVGTGLVLFCCSLDVFLFTVYVDVMRKLLVAAGALVPLIANLSSKIDDVVEQTLKVLTTLSLTGFAVSSYGIISLHFTRGK